MQVWPRKWKGTCLLSFEGSVCGVVNQPLKTSLVYFSTNVVSKCLTLNSLSYRNLCTFLVVDSAKVSDAINGIAATFILLFSSVSTRTGKYALRR